MNQPFPAQPRPTIISVLNDFFRDVIAGALRWPLWTYLAWRDIRMRYVRTVFGPFWLTLSTGIFILAFGTIYSTLFGQDMATYLPFLTGGFLPWILFSTIVTESCTAFTLEKTVILSWQFPYSILIYRVVCRNLIVFAHNFAILMVVYAIYGLPLSLNMLWMPVGLVLLAVNGLWIGLLFGTLCSRFRDIQPLIASILQITMFVTPIFWSPEMLSGRRAVIVDINIVYHMIAIIREPILGRMPPMASLAVVSAFAVVGLVTTALFYGRFRRRIPFWL